jgi:hypothetical protein
MRAPLIALTCGAGPLLLTAPALGNPYDDCILQHMGTAQDKTAVNAIERACIAKTSIAIPPDDNFAGGLNANIGKFNTGSGAADNSGLLVTMKNTTIYNVTEVVVRIVNKRTQEIARYPIDSFSEPFPPGTVLTGLGEPALLQIVKPGETRRFFVHIDEAMTQPADDFGKKFTWGVTPTKGIPAN